MHKFMEFTNLIYIPNGKSNLHKSNANLHDATCIGYKQQLCSEQVDRSAVDGSGG